MIIAENIHKRVATNEGELAILRGINLRLGEGESLAIVGASGSGKSTLLGILAGLDNPTEGHVTLNGQNLSVLDEDDKARLRANTLSFVFQNFQLIPGLTALENVMLPLELKGVKNAKQKAVHYLTQVGLQGRHSHYPPQLSGGEQQRVAVARAFASEPKILFADEPTGNLDARTGENIINLLFDLNERSKTTLVLVTHEQRLAARCKKQLTLDAGATVKTSEFEQPQSAFSAELADKTC